MENSERIIEILKRIETKLTFSLNAQEISTTKDGKYDSAHPSPIFMKTNEDGEDVIYLRHTDISLKDFNDFLKNKHGQFKVVVGDKVIWQIKK